MTEERLKELELEYKKKLNTLVIIRNSVSLVCFTVLAIVFNKWWIVFFSILFYAFVGKEEE